MNEHTDGAALLAAKTATYGGGASAVWFGLSANEFAALVGALVPNVVVSVAGDLLPVPPVLGLHPKPLLAAVLFGMLVAFAFAIAPLARASALPAQRMFRGERCETGFWTGSEWDRSTFKDVNARKD